MTRRSLGYYKEKLKLFLGVLGHSPGWAQSLRAWRQAIGPKRIDRIAGAVVAAVRRAGFETLRGRRVMEFGTGHLLSEAIVSWLAGASEVVATDYFPIVQVRAARWALTSADTQGLADALGAVQDRAAIIERLEKLRAISPWTLPILSELGIRYYAPMDAAQPLPDIGKFDLIMSLSVMEHVPGPMAGPILRHLQDALVPEGVQHHHIHLEDHRDLRRAPFAFLGADDDYQPSQCDARGNRLRASDWIALASTLPVAEVEAADRLVKQDAMLPARLDPAFDGYDPIDLRTAGVALLVRRVG